MLLGVAPADYLVVWCETELLPPPARVGVLPTDDPYSAATGEERPET